MAQYKQRNGRKTKKPKYQTTGEVGLGYEVRRVVFEDQSADSVMREHYALALFPTSTKSKTRYAKT